MKQRVSDFMTKFIVEMPAQATVTEAARAMRDRQIGAVVVTDGRAIAGMATDRDLVVRGIAAGMDPATTRLVDVTSRELVTVESDASPAEAAQVMRDRAVRRLLVTDRDGHLIGLLSIGDLAVELDRESALGHISAAPANA